MRKNKHGVERNKATSETENISWLNQSSIHLITWESETKFVSDNEGRVTLGNDFTQVIKIRVFRGITFLLFLFLENE